MKAPAREPAHNGRRRQRVVRVGLVYGIVAWIILEGASSLLVADSWPSWTVQFAIGLVIMGLPVALFLAWSWEESRADANGDGGTKTS